MDALEAAELLDLARRRLEQPSVDTTLDELIRRLLDPDEQAHALASAFNSAL